MYQCKTTVRKLSLFPYLESINQINNQEKYKECQKWDQIEYGKYKEYIYKVWNGYQKNKKYQTIKYASDYRLW